MPNRFAILFVVLCACNAIVAQQDNYVFRHIDQHDGLAHNDVFDITQDSRGFVWLITRNGLQRYDGSRFVNFNERLNVSFELNDDDNVYTDEKNLIYITEINKIQTLATVNNVFAAELPVQVMYNAISFTDEHQRKIFLTRQGCFFYDSVNKKYQWKTLNIHPYTANESNFFSTDRETGNVWALAGEGLVQFDMQTKQIYSINYNPKHNTILDAFKQQIKPSDARRVLVDNNNNLWIITWGGLFFKYDVHIKKMYTYSLVDFEEKQGDKKEMNIKSPASVNSLFQDDRGAIWASTDYDGLLKYDAAKNTFKQIPLNEKNRQSQLFNYQVYSIYQDKDENIWLGTDNGITIFNPYKQYFTSVHHDDALASMPKSEIQSFIQTPTGDILIGSWGAGIAVYDSAWNFKKNIQNTKPAYEGNLVWSFLQKDSNTVWAGCQHGYIHVIDVKLQTIQTINPPELDNSTIWCMTKDDEGNIWLGLHNGKIAEWNKQTNKFYPLPGKDENEKASLVPVKNILIDSHKNIWACTEYGLKKFDAVQMCFTEDYLPVADDSSSISSKNIEAVIQHNDSILLVGTLLGGMDLFNINTKKFTRYTIQNGFPSNTVHSIKKDNEGYVWFTTDYSLYKYKPAEKKFILYNIEPGIINAAFNSSQLYSLQNGDWCTSTPTEVIYFDPKVLSVQNDHAVNVEIAGFRLFDKPFLIDSFLSNNKPVVLNYKQNFFTIEFAALDFSDILQTKYYYKLSDINNDWVNAGARKSASYTNLEPGKYIFSVRADNGNSISKETSFTIIIEPPFWKTTWFIVLSLLLITAVIYLLVLRRIKSIRSKAEMKQKMAETEMIALRAQMNPHFIFNCLNSIDNLIQTNEKEKATTYLARFAKLIRAFLENSKSNAIPCWKDLEALKLYLELEALRWGKKISYTLNVAPEILQGDYKVPPMIIQPYVENAIHHGLLNKESGECNLFIEVRTEKNHIIYTIEDNGIGRKRAMEYKLLNKPGHQSMGLDITKERINLFNKDNNGSVTITDLYNEHHEATGTRVNISIIN